MKQKVQDRLGIPVETQKYREVELNQTRDFMENCATKEKSNVAPKFRNGDLLRLEDTTPPIIVKGVLRSDIRIALMDLSSFPFVPLSSTQYRQNGFVQSSVCVLLFAPWLLAVVCRCLFHFVLLFAWEKVGIIGTRKFSHNFSTMFRRHAYWKYSHNSSLSKKKGSENIDNDIENWTWVTDVSKFGTINFFEKSHLLFWIF